MSSAILKLIQPKAKDIGDFEVRRALPQIDLRSVGPWVFFDHFGPVVFGENEAMDVRPHPHINLATVTYLFEGAIQHRDSLGNDLAIKPGEINLMVAGRGITHSERTPEPMRGTGQHLHGLQLWHALPTEFEEIAPEFHNYSAQDIPRVQINNTKISVMIGIAYGVSSPVKSFCPTLYIEAQMTQGSALELPQSQELAIYVVSGQLDLEDEIVSEGAMVMIDMSMPRQIKANDDAHVVMIGGAPLGKRYMEWNFVSSRSERVEQAKQDWRAGRFPIIPGDDAEFIPLP